LVIIDSDQTARLYAKKYLSARNVRVIGEATEIKAGQRLVHGLLPDVVLLELPENGAETIEFVRRVREDQPDIGFVIAKHQPSSQTILGCIRAGAQEFVGRPLDGPEVEKALGHVRRLTERTYTNGKKHGVLLSIFSSKGGIGASSTAANLAVALAKESAGSTVLVDMSFQLGDLGLMFDRPARYSLVDALDNDSLDNAKLRSIIDEHDSGVGLLTVVASPELAQDITHKHVVELFAALNTMFDFVVVDLGRHLDERTAEVLELSDAILLLSTVDVPSIRNLSKYLGMFSRFELEEKKIHVVLNRYSKKTRLTLKDVEDVLGKSIFWTIPNDFEPMSSGIDGGTPVILDATRSKLARNFRELAEVCRQMFTEASMEAKTDTAN
jgi:pilus assembly protein CpaE